MANSPAYNQFLKSMNIGYDEWHDGIGYDLEAFAAMTPEERDATAAEFIAKPNLEWREMEVLGAHGGKQSMEKLRDLLTDPSIDARAHALDQLIDAGKTPGSVADVQLAHILDKVTSDDGMTMSLMLAQAHGGPMSKLALLRGAQNRPDVALHYASTLLDMAGLSDDMAAFDPKFRPMLLRMLPDNTPEDQAAAFNEFCAILEIDPKTIPTPDSGNSFKWAETKWPRE